MGSISSRPRVPAQPQVIYYVPQQQQAAAPAESGEPGPDEVAAEQRRKNLLSRGRGRFGTIRTSFRGLLSLAGGGDGQPKTLLGE